jgi:hypothetical protein
MVYVCPVKNGEQERFHRGWLKITAGFNFSTVWINDIENMPKNQVLFL